jgi:hypothetical protein
MRHFTVRACCPVITLQGYIKKGYKINTLVRQKQAIGILGMVFAVAGGIAWFFQARIPALILWGIAIVIIFKLKQKKRTKY